MRALTLCLILLFAVPVAAQARPTATASKSCNISGKERSFGVTYVTSLSAKGTSCGKAKGVVKAYHSCRHEKGKAGKCSKKVKGYSCSEGKRSSSPIQYDAKVTCTNGSKTVKHSYTQDT